jgi:hypothetical protein
MQTSKHNVSRSTTAPRITTHPHHPHHPAQMQPVPEAVGKHQAMKVFSSLALALALLSPVDGGRVKVKGSKPPSPAHEKEVRISSVALCATEILGYRARTTAVAARTTPYFILLLF